MPALRIYVVETHGRMEPRVRAAARLLPIEVIAQDDLLAEDDFRGSWVLIEHEGDLPRTVRLVEQATERGGRGAIFFNSPASPLARLALRAAGARLLWDRLPSFEGWKVLIERWSQAHQERFAWHSRMPSDQKRGL